MRTGQQQETRPFQAEVRQLLRLMIHSLYSNREIFLRELISNASDACDKLRFESLSRPELTAEGGELAIRIDFDSRARTITVADNGVGMSRDEAIEHLGTIARSGTADFMSRLTGDEQRDSQLIGQFGVGFYSAFIVAERVEVFSLRAGQATSEGVHWVSSADGEFTVETIELRSRGTRIVLHLKEDTAEFADAFRLRGLIRRYSDHIAFPVLLRPDGGKGEYDRCNQATALWTRARADIKDDEYREFYRHITHDAGDPLAWSHNRVEGRREFTTLLYLPGKAPFDLWNRDAPRGLKLYVRRVFILDNAEQFLPLYLRFVRGVVDSADLPLNVSREILQEDREVEAMRGAITRRVLDMLTRLAEEDHARYLDFWREFGGVLKEGIAEDPASRDRLARLLRFVTTRGGDVQEHSLQDYVARMPAGQKHIYYVTADTVSRARSSPHLEALRTCGVEVLLLPDRIDEWMVAHLGEFDGHELRDVARGALDLDALATPDEVLASRAAATDIEPVCQRLAAVLGPRVAAVRASQRLADSAACLVRAEHEPGPQLRRLLESAGQTVPASAPTLEINPRHALIQHLSSLADSQVFTDLAELTFDLAVLAEGGALLEPQGFIHRVQRLLLEGLPEGTGPQRIVIA
ncbi:MAG: molecular chaperone HtpG [Steroidobacteraceae bacterium]